MNSSFDGPSVQVEGEQSTVNVHGGSFFGKWHVASGGRIVVHACTLFTLDFTGGTVHAVLLDGTRIDVPYTNDGTGAITSSQEGCDDNPNSSANEAHSSTDLVNQHQILLERPSLTGSVSDTTISQPGPSKPTSLSLKLDASDDAISSNENGIEKIASSSEGSGRKARLFAIYLTVSLFWNAFA